MKITGYYNESGYHVETDNPMDAIIYRVGIHALDSQQDGTGTKHQLLLETIRQYCEQTTRGIAQNRDAEFIGVEYLESEDM